MIAKVSHLPHLQKRYSVCLTTYPVYDQGTIGAASQLRRISSYVGTLHEISSENSTVALEQVKSFGTEGRNPEDEVPASDNIYEYIVFRGSDVKDLRIEKEPEKSAQQPQVPDDPAILGVSFLSVLLCAGSASSGLTYVPLCLLDDEVFRM